MRVHNLSGERPFVSLQRLGRKRNIMECKKNRKFTLRKRKTRFVEIFRTTPAKTVCPNFFVLTHANGCAFTPECSYCFL